jgi:hypothetical protein
MVRNTTREPQEGELKMDGYGEIRFRAQHGEGLALDKVRAGARQVTLRLRDKYRAALEAILCEHGVLEAAVNLEIAFLAHTRGLGFTLSDVERIRGTAGSSDALALLIAVYNDWHAECKRRHLSPLMCKRVIIEGYSLSAVDEEWHFRKGTAKKNLVDCLTLFADMTK